MTFPPILGLIPCPTKESKEVVKFGKIGCAFLMGGIFLAPLFAQLA
jgi:hypothetical protein